MHFSEQCKEDVVRKKLANELKPEQIKESIIQVDKAYNQLLTVNENLGFADFGDGVYSDLPKVLRGNNNDMGPVKEHIQSKNTLPKILQQHKQNKQENDSLIKRLERGIRFQILEK